MSSDVITVSEALATPALIENNLISIIPKTNDAIDYTDSFTTLFNDATIVNNPDPTPTAVTMKVDRSIIKRISERLTMLTNINAKNINVILDAINESMASPELDANEIELSRNTVSLLSDFTNELPSIDNTLQGIRDDAALLFSPINVSDVMILPDNEFTDKVVSALDDEAFVSRVVNHSSIMASDFAIESVGDIKTIPEVAKESCNIANMSDSVNNNIDSVHAKIFDQIDEALNLLFSAKTLVSDLRLLSPLEANDTDKANLDLNLSLLEQDWAASALYADFTTLSKDDKAKITAHMRLAKDTYWKQYDKSERLDSMKLETDYVNSGFIINHTTIDFLSSDHDSVTVTGIHSGHKMTLSKFRGVLSSLKNIWNNFISKAGDSTILKNALAAAGDYAKDKLTRINKIHNKSFDVDLLSSVVTSGFGTVATSYPTDYKAAAYNLGLNAVPLIYDSIKNKVKNTTDKKSNLLNRVNAMSKVISSDINAKASISTKRFRIQRKSLFISKSVKISNNSRIQYFGLAGRGSRY
ncbi:58 kDa protein [Psammotettix alienus reovirus]|nr:58 kDa protein [Psammotettix alienus reovirus]